MFLIFNKQKIYAYLISIVTVLLLFCAATTVKTESKMHKTTNTGNTINIKL